MAIYINGKKVAGFGGRQGPQGEPGKQGPAGQQGPPGVDGQSPFIGENGNWWLGDTDTGVSASGSAAGVVSFNGRTGAVQPAAGDYTAQMVGAMPDSFAERDPTVPAWAKTPEKPAYTADEVGALPAGTSIPAATSDLENDSGFVTETEMNTAITEAVHGAILASWEAEY